MSNRYVKLSFSSLKNLLIDSLLPSQQTLTPMFQVVQIKNLSVIFGTFLSLRAHMQSTVNP
jgi:hypothetical protein